MRKCLSAGSVCTQLFIDELIEYKLSLTHLQSSHNQPTWLPTQSVQSTCRTRSSSVVTLARPSVSSLLQITNRSFRYASPHLWNKLPSSFRQSHCVHSPPGSRHPARITSWQSPPSLSPSITPSVFHSRLLSFTNLFLHSLLISSDCLHGSWTFTELSGHWRFLV